MSALYNTESLRQTTRKNLLESNDHYYAYLDKIGKVSIVCFAVSILLFLGLSAIFTKPDPNFKIPAPGSLTIIDNLLGAIIGPSFIINKYTPPRIFSHPQCLADLGITICERTYSVSMKILLGLGVFSAITAAGAALKMQLIESSKMHQKKFNRRGWNL
ncbi:MAG: hypothetical protein H7A40_00275 [Chlamydiales bacterium]|nr:hypothetical protein [Chlamydiales bacterium]